MSKKTLFISGLLLFTAITNGEAQIVIIGELIKKALMAADLRVQKLQNKTIFLQEAQKVIENLMHRLYLSEITGWAAKQETLFNNYYQELWEIKEAILYYKEVKEIIDKQIGVIKDYQAACSLLLKDTHFSDNERSDMIKVYGSILQESIRNIELLDMVIRSYVTQMPDADRLRIINEAERRIDSNYTALHRVMHENFLLSLQRARDGNDIHALKLMYGVK